MKEPKSIDVAHTFSEEVQYMAGINERFSKEPENIRNMRIKFANQFRDLVSLRDLAGRSFA